MTHENQPIPQFDLYGELTLYDNPGFVHIEDIADRSQKNDWVIKPHRHGKMLQILFIFSGKTWVEVDDDQHNFNGERIVIIPPGVIHGFRFQPDTRGKVLTIAEPVLTSTSFRACKEYFDPVLSKSTIIQPANNIVLINQVRNYLNLLESELEKNGLGQEQMLEWLLSMLIMTLRRNLEYSNHRMISRSTHAGLLDKFREMIELNFREQWSVKQYANALHTSYSTLNRKCQEASGLPAKELIQNRMIVAAKRQLIYTQAPLDHIAHRLGFKDPAYFSRIFKKRTSLSPNAYRKLKFHEFHTFHE